MPDERAQHGEILVHPVCSATGEPTALEILAIDKGPGIPDMALSRRDGHSTAGSLGHGLGAIGRLADSLEFCTHSSGTVFAARVSRDQSRAARNDWGYDIGAVQVSKPGELVCGDGWGWRLRPGRLAIFVVDGLGHGFAAHDAATIATGVFARGHECAPRHLLEDAHVALRPSRGAAVAFVAADLERGVAAYCGVGNITGTILMPGGRHHSMVSHNGTAGHTAGRMQEFNYPLLPGSVLVLCSDGLQTHWDLAAYPGVWTRSASVIAGILYRDFSRRREDTTVVVAKVRARVPEPS